MNTLLRLCLCLLLATHALAADEKGTPTAVAQAFMDSYIQDATREGGGDPDKLVKNSPYLTASLKKAHAKFFQQETVDADPILDAQDFPDKGFKASQGKIEGKKSPRHLHTARGRLGPHHQGRTRPRRWQVAHRSHRRSLKPVTPLRFEVLERSCSNFGRSFYYNFHN